MVFFGLLVAFGCLALGACAIFNQAKFGKEPEGERLARVRSSPNYGNGEFRNTIPTQTLADGQSTFKILWSNLSDKTPRLRPEGPVPTVKTDLKSLDAARDVVIWLGHSSYYIQLGGRRVLVDPVFSDYAAPFSFINKIFAGTGIYTAEDMPEIDFLLISHDHWDHLDYPTVTELKSKVKTVVCPLGVGAHFEHWGYAKERIHEADWGDAPLLDGDLAIHVLPARHYSGRLFSRNKTLWAGFALQSPKHKLFMSGDSGYGPHFAEIGRSFGGFDLVMLDSGQYDPRWPYIHMTPEEAARAAEDLQAAALLPAHIGKFCISVHAWDEPFIRVVAVSAAKGFHLISPMIGEPVWLDDKTQKFSRWWESVK